MLRDVPIGHVLEVLLEFDGINEHRVIDGWPVGQDDFATVQDGHADLAAFDDKFQRISHQHLSADSLLSGAATLERADAASLSKLDPDNLDAWCDEFAVVLVPENGAEPGGNFFDHSLLTPHPLFFSFVECSLISDSSSRRHCVILSCGRFGMHCLS